MLANSPALDADGRSCNTLTGRDIPEDEIQEEFSPDVMEDVQTFLDRIVLFLEESPKEDSVDA